MSNFASTHPNLKNLSTMDIYKKKDYIYQYGDLTQGVYRVLEGRVKLWKQHDGTKRRLTLYMVETFGFFGVLEPFLNHGSRRCGAMAMDKKVVVQHLSFANFKSKYLNDYEGKMAVLKAFGDQQKVVWEKHNEYQETNMVDKVYRMLQRLSHEVGISTEGGILVEGISHRELADYIGLSRQIVTMAMNDLKKANRIEYGRKRILIAEQTDS